MKSRSVVVMVVGLLVAALLVTRMVFYKVEFTEWAVVETFGKLDPNPVPPGLHARLPWPVQRVITYDNRMQTFEDGYEEFPVAGNFQVMMSLYVCWRIETPAKFRETLGDRLELGADALRRLSTNAKKDVLSRYPMSNLVSLSPKDLKLVQIQTQIQERLAAEAKDSYGIEIIAVGIKRLGLPPAASKTVMDTMRKEREELAQRYESGGKAEAVRITSEADNIARQILSFAQSKASDIRVEGDTKAAAYLARYEKYKGFAAFLRRLDFLKAALSTNSQFLLSGQNAPEMGDDPSVGWFGTPPTAKSLEREFAAEAVPDADRQ